MVRPFINRRHRRKVGGADDDLAKDTHTCAIRPDQTVQCWGDLGISVPGLSEGPPVATFKQVVAGAQRRLRVMCSRASLACPPRVL